MKIKRKQAEMTVGAVKQMIREEVKAMLKDGTIRLELDADTTFYSDTLEIKLDVYVDNQWVCDTKDMVTLPNA